MTTSQARLLSYINGRTVSIEHIAATRIRGSYDLRALVQIGIVEFVNENDRPHVKRVTIH